MKLRERIYGIIHAITRRHYPELDREERMSRERIRVEDNLEHRQLTG